MITFESRAGPRPRNLPGVPPTTAVSLAGSVGSGGLASGGDGSGGWGGGSHHGPGLQSLVKGSVDSTHDDIDKRMIHCLYTTCNYDCYTNINCKDVDH
jgi:hypothetical protein